MSVSPIVAVTGASGYIGSVIADALKDEAEVLALIREPTKPGQIGFSFDGDMDLLARRLREHRVTHLIHAAWDMHASSTDELERGCVKGSLALLDSARRAGVEKFILISTISAFESARSNYGRSKLKVEQAFQRFGGLVLRLGLVYGERAGGAFGVIKNIVGTARFLPLIGDGRVPQYLLDEKTLRDVVRRAVRGEFEGERQILTLAHPKPIAFRDILIQVARSREGRRLLLVPIPWRLLYCLLFCLERLGFTPNVKSDSILSFVHQNPAPDFGPMRRCSIEPAPFRATPVSSSPTESARTDGSTNGKANF